MPSEELDEDEPSTEGPLMNKWEIAWLAFLACGYVSLLAVEQFPQVSAYIQNAWHAIL